MLKQMKLQNITINFKNMNAYEYSFHKNDIFYRNEKVFNKKNLSTKHSNNILETVDKKTFTAKCFNSKIKSILNNRALLSCMHIKNMFHNDDTLFTVKRFFTSKNNEKTYDYKLIYTGEFANKVRIVKIFSLTTSMIGLAVQPALFLQMQESLPIGLAIMFMTNLFVFLTPLLLHIITKRYVTEMLYNPSTKMFIATTYSFFLSNKTHLFSRDDAVESEQTQMLANIIIHKKIPLFFDPTAFTDKEAYIYLMKYDQPLEWQIRDDETQTFDFNNEENISKDLNIQNKINNVKIQNHNTQKNIS